MGQPKQQTLVMIDERAIGTDQDKKFVMAVGDDSRAVYRPITLGGAVDGLRIVTSGLKSGDRIVVNGLQRVRPGALVKTEVAAMGARAAGRHRQQPARRATLVTTRGAACPRNDQVIRPRHRISIPGRGRHSRPGTGELSIAQGHESLKVLHRPADLRRRAVGH